MSDDDQLAFASIVDLAPRLRSGELSPVELARVCLDRISRLEPAINAYITVLPEGAIMAAARGAEAEIRSGSYRGPLHGIPIAHKDLFYTRGILTTAGSKILADFVPEGDATAVAKLEAAGTILLGKLNMHEFAAGGTSDNPHYGPVHNPWKLDRIPGGSSGGSAAALAAGMCFGATGSDTAGSIRIPSHCCGTSGIKPTYGRVSCFGVVPLSWALDHPGPMARSARDAALMLNVMAGFDARDPASVDQPVPDFTAGIDMGVRGLRVGIPQSYFNENLQPDVELAWRQAIDVLAGLGASLVELEFSAVGQAVAVGSAILATECTAFHESWYRERPHDYGRGLVDRFETNRQLPAVEYVKAQRTRMDIQAEIETALAKADVIVTPMVPVTATPIGATTVDIRGQSYPLPSQLLRFTYPFNLSGLPAASVPCGFDREGLPIGLQIVAPRWQEALALRVGHAYQCATDWHLRRPELPER